MGDAATGVGEVCQAVVLLPVPQGEFLSGGETPKQVVLGAEDADLGHGRAHVDHLQKALLVVERVGHVEGADQPVHRRREQHVGALREKHGLGDRLAVTLLEGSHWLRALAPVPEEHASLPARADQEVSAGGRRGQVHVVQLLPLVGRAGRRELRRLLGSAQVPQPQGPVL
eukprot:scaffold549_cov385-Prasinococcus_capsulatus_cf.AAC.36